MTTLNERQKDLLRHLQANSNRFLTQIEIVVALKEYYRIDEISVDVPFHDSWSRHLLTKDIRTINNCDDADVVIISSNKGIKIANEDEFDKYIRNQYASVFRKLARVRKKERKGKLNNQLRMTASGDIDTVTVFGDMRKNRGLKAAEVVDYMKQIEPRFDGSLLSKIENGICLPTYQQEMAMMALYTSKEK